MKVLIAGGYNVFVSQLVEKFKKEGWEVYLLTGTKTPERRHAYVFEQYDFPYSSESIKEILASASPDLVLFAGAYDAGFSAQCTRQESMSYMSGLVNLLMTSQILNVPSFVYISSHEVYEESYADPISEEQPVTPVSTRGLLVAQGEELVLRYGETTKMNTLVLRLDHLYWIPNNRKEIGEPYARMCFGALRDGQVSGSGNRIFSSVFVADAVYTIYEILQRPERRHTVYNITAGDADCELDIAKTVAGAAGENVTVKDDTFGPVRRNVMSAQRVQEEFGIQPRFHAPERVERIMERMKEDPNAFLLRDEREATWFERLRRRFEKTAMALLPFIENGILFIFVFLLNNRTADSAYFRRLDVFLLYVVLFAVFYGKRQAILAAFLSSIGFIFRQSYYRTGVEVLVDYNIYIWMAQLFIVGMAVGHLRDSLKIVTDDKNEQIDFLTGQLDDIYDINSSNLKVKNILEEHIISYEDSLGVLQNLTQRLEKLNPGEALYEAVGVLSEVMGTRDVAIYKVSNARYCRLLVATTDGARGLGKSFQYSEQEALSKSLGAQEVFVNRTLQPGLPVMAYGLQRGETLEYILMIWNLPFEKLSLHQMDLLKVVGDMIHNAITRSDVYLEALSEKRHVANTTILSEEAFADRIQTDRELREHAYAESALLRVQSAGPAEDVLREAGELERLDHIFTKNLRETDAVGIGADGYFQILLANSSDHDAQTVIRRFEGQGIQCVLSSAETIRTEPAPDKADAPRSTRRAARPESFGAFRLRRQQERRSRSGVRRLLDLFSASRTGAGGVSRR